MTTNFADDSLAALVSGGEDRSGELSLLLTTPLAPAEAYHPRFWFWSSLAVWIVLHLFITPIYARVADALHALYRLSKRMRGVKHTLPSDAIFAPELSWGTRMTRAYNSLSPSKRAYWRRLLRAFIYYFSAVITGFYLLLSHYRTVLDIYFIHTPGMDIAFCFAASHFVWCCVEDWPCRSHMGKSRCEQLAVFWGYIVHHVITAAAYLMAVKTHQMGIMCLMGLTFEGPVFFACLREVVSLYDEDFDLFNRVPAWLQKLNWICAFVSLIPCRYVSIGFFIYAAVNWNMYLRMVAPEVQACYWTFGGIFLFINVYFTWLLTYWYGQDKRYVRKKKMLAAKQAEERAGLLRQQEEARLHGQESELQAMHPGIRPLSPLLPGTSPAGSPMASPLGVDSPHPHQRHAAQQPLPTQSEVQIVYA